MNESFPFPLVITIVLPAACLVAALLSQVPSGFLLSPGDVLPGLAQLVMPLDGVLEGMEV